MGEAGDDSDPADLSPAEAFSLLGNEHRVAIVETLLDLHRTGDEYPTSFSTLRECSGINVSSQFSYHLAELTGHFLKQTDEGYAFRYAGWKIATAILAGTYNRREQFGPAPIDGTCPLCETAALEAAYRDEWMQIDCTACENRLTRYPFPPGGLAGREPSEFLRVFDRHVRTHMHLARDGICPACTGPMTPVVYSETEASRQGRAVEYDCTRCGNRLYPNCGMFLLETPPVLAFYRNHGSDIRAVPYWEFEFCVNEDCTTIISEQPWRCQIRITLDSDVLCIEVDDDLSVVSSDVQSMR